MPKPPFHRSENFYISPAIEKYFTASYAKKAKYTHVHYLHIDSDKGGRQSKMQQIQNPMPSPR